MKLSDVEHHWEFLIAKVADGTITADIMNQACRALIEIKKVAAVECPFAYCGDEGELFYFWLDMNVNSKVQLEFSPITTEFSYCNNEGDDFFFGDYDVGNEPIPPKVVDKLKLCVED